MSDGVRHLNREMADEMCNQASLDSMREQHYKDSVEIDRLERELAEALDLLATVQKEHTWYAYKYSELGSQLADAKARIEELEQDVARLEDDKAFWKNPPNGVWVEKDQIDAAWAEGQEVYSEHSSFYHALNFFGIGACEDCYGSGRIPAPWNEESGETVKCYPCDGHGWRKK